MRPYYGYSNNYSNTTKYNNYPLLKSTVAVSPRGEEKELKTFSEPVKFGTSTSTAPPELMSFIERQEDYIEQLEKESGFCKEELASLLSKVKHVIDENETLHKKQKSRLFKSVIDHLETETETEMEIGRHKRIHKQVDSKRGGRKRGQGRRHVPKSSSKPREAPIVNGSSIMFESRISELEAQLTQAKMNLKKALEENESIRSKLIQPSSYSGPGYELFRKQIEESNRENEEMKTKVINLQAALSDLREKKSDISDQVKRSLDVTEEAQYEKSTSELEIRRLKDELERQHMKLRKAIGDQSRRIADERSAVERRYTQQIEQMTAELGGQWESTNKLQLELDKQRRENVDLRREVVQKQAWIDDMRKDMQNRITNLQSVIGVSGAEKSALEEQVGNLQMVNERTERQYKQEIARLQTEMQSLRQRLDRADADLILSRRENLGLSEQLASLEKELKLNDALVEERTKTATPKPVERMALPSHKSKTEADRERELSSLIEQVEKEHAATVAGLEDMVHSQNQLMDKLSTECHLLAEKLEDASVRHK